MWRWQIKVKKCLPIQCSTAFLDEDTYTCHHFLTKSPWIIVFRLHFAGRLGCTSSFGCMHQEPVWDDAASRGCNARELHREHCQAALGGGCQLFDSMKCWYHHNEVTLGTLGVFFQHTHTERMCWSVMKLRFRGPLWYVRMRQGAEKCNVFFNKTAGRYLSWELETRVPK